MSQFISIQFDHLNDVAGTLRRTGVMERTVALEQFVEEEFVFAMRNINFSGENVTMEMLFSMIKVQVKMTSNTGSRNLPRFPNTATWTRWSQLTARSALARTARGSVS